MCNPYGGQAEHAPAGLETSVLPRDSAVPCHSKT